MGKESAFGSFDELPSIGPDGEFREKGAPEDKKKEKKDPARLGRMLLQQMGISPETAGDKLSYDDFFVKGVQAGWRAYKGRKQLPMAVFGGTLRDAFELYYGVTDRVFDDTLTDLMNRGIVSAFGFDKGFMIALPRPE